ncbi:MAG: hypothetical protein WC730_03765 [Patescibacteria group bacterium]|jgi:hypothetical protein
MLRILSDEEVRAHDQKAFKSLRRGSLFSYSVKPGDTRYCVVFESKDIFNRIHAVELNEKNIENMLRGVAPEVHWIALQSLRCINVLIP